LSTDDKPFPLDDVDLSLMVGARFYETDTCDVYVWDGEQWQLENTVLATTAVANTTASGTIDAVNETVECVVSPGAGTVGCQLTGTWAAAGDLIIFEATTDGTNWIAIYTSMGASAVLITGSNGIYQLGAAGYVKVRARGYTWGAAASCYVSFNSTVGPSAVVISTPLPQGANFLGTQGIWGYRSSDATYQPLRLDKATNSIQIIDYAHHEIHAGSSFTCHYSQTAPTNVGEMTMIAFNTPDSTTYLHMFAEASSTAASTFSIYEVADLDVDEGTQLTIYNRDRNSSTLSTVTIIETTPVANKATSYSVVQAAGATLSTAIPIYVKYLGAAAAGADTSGETRDSHEFILKRNTQYAFVIANTTDDTNTHNIILNWYEHANIA
jgi:hypothetical protein